MIIQIATAVESKQQSRNEKIMFIVVKRSNIEIKFCGAMLEYF
jgi:hypothetical protein